MATATAPRVDACREIVGVGRLDFTEDPHAYWFLPEGAQRRSRFPSVTGILGDTWSDRALLEWYMREPDARAQRDEGQARGKDAHRFIETYLKTGVLLPFSDFEPQRRPYIQGAARFIFENDPDPDPDGIERLIIHPELRYAGRLDFIGKLKDSRARTLLDYKTNPAGNVYAKAHVQGMAYVAADKRCGGEPVERVGIVGLTGDGTYRIVWTPMDEAAQVWASALAHNTAIKALLKALGER